MEDLKSESGDLSLNIIRHKRGYRWRVYRLGNLFCTGTDYHATEREAENEAIRTFCKAWTIERKDDERT